MGNRDWDGGEIAAIRPPVGTWKSCRIGVTQHRYAKGVTTCYFSFVVLQELAVCPCRYMSSTFFSCSLGTLQFPTETLKTLANNQIK